MKIKVKNKKEVIKMNMYQKRKERKEKKERKERKEKSKNYLRPCRMGDSGL